MFAQYLLVLLLCFVRCHGGALPCEPGRELLVRPGDAVKLECACRMESGEDLHWLRSCTPLVQPLIISSVKSIINPTPRFVLTWNNSTGSVDLNIGNISELDLGLYYCAQVEQKRHQTSSGKLQESDVYRICQNSSTKLSYKAVPTATASPACNCGMYLMLLCVLGLVFSVLLASVCIYFCCCRTATTEKETKEQRRESFKMSSETDVNYASLSMPESSSQRTKRNISPGTDFSMYSQLSQHHR